MPVRVRVPTPLRKFTNGADEVNAQGNNVKTLVDDLEKNLSWHQRADLRRDRQGAPFRQRLRQRRRYSFPAKSRNRAQRGRQYFHRARDRRRQLTVANCAAWHRRPRPICAWFTIPSERAREGRVGSRSDRQHSPARDSADFRRPSRGRQNLRETGRVQSRRLGKRPAGMANGARRTAQRQSFSPAKRFSTRLRAIPVSPWRWSAACSVIRWNW